VRQCPGTEEWLGAPGAEDALLCWYSTKAGICMKISASENGKYGCLGNIIELCQHGKAMSRTKTILSCLVFISIGSCAGINEFYQVFF